jgi:hypothetical protein
MKKRKSPIPLTERLRDWSEGPDTAHLCDEAADEIEMLRDDRDGFKAALLYSEGENDRLSRELAEARAALVKIRDHAESAAPAQIGYWARAALADQSSGGDDE